MPPWVKEFLDALIGPWGALIFACAVIYFLWKLFREEQKENRENFKTVGTLAAAVTEANSEAKAAHAEVKEWRDVFIMESPRATRRPQEPLT